MPYRALLFIVGLALISAMPVARGAEKVWSGLVMAQNVEKPEKIPAPLSRLEQTLKELFGYNQFEVIGESTKTLKTGDEDWLATSKYFSLHVDARGVSDNGYELNLALFQDKQVLLETETKLSKRSPLVIKGPQIGGGQLLLVLIIDDDPERNQASERKHSKPETNPVKRAWNRLSHLVRNTSP